MKPEVNSGMRWILQHSMSLNSCYGVLPLSQTCFCKVYQCFFKFSIFSLYFFLSSSSWSHILHFKSFSYFYTILCCITVSAILFQFTSSDTTSQRDVYYSYLSLLTSYTSVLLLPCFVSFLIWEIIGILKYEQYSIPSSLKVFKESM